MVKFARLAADGRHPELKRQLELMLRGYEGQRMQLERTPAGQRTPEQEQQLATIATSIALLSGRAAPTPPPTPPRPQVADAERTERALRTNVYLEALRVAEQLRTMDLQLDEARETRSADPEQLAARVHALRHDAAGLVEHASQQLNSSLAKLASLVGPARTTYLPLVQTRLEAVLELEELLLIRTPHTDPAWASMQQRAESHKLSLSKVAAERRIDARIDNRLATSPELAALRERARKEHEAREQFGEL